MRLNKPVDMMVGPEKAEEFRGYLDGAGLSCSTMIEDVGATLARRGIEGAKDLKASQSDTGDFFSDFRSLQDVYNYMDWLGSSYPNVANTYSLGSTYEGVDMKAMWLSVGNTADNRIKPIIFIDGGMHSRWVVSRLHTSKVSFSPLFSSKSSQSIQCRHACVVTGNGSRYRQHHTSWTD